MKVTVFTSNQPRHVALIEALAGWADEVYAVQECSTICPGEVADFFRKSEVMREYFSRVLGAEREVFGQTRFLPGKVRSLAIKMGDLNRVSMEQLRPALASDVYVVFGASFIKGALCEHLVKHRAYNIHMGVSPYYRGSSTNFWAMYDRRVEYVGATIHLLTTGLDSGPMLFHAFPPVMEADPFVVGMRAVRSAHQGLIEALRSGKIAAMTPVVQDKGLQVRYSRNAEFTDEVAREYLERLPTGKEMGEALTRREMGRFLQPYIG